MSRGSWWRRVAGLRRRPGRLVGGVVALAVVAGAAVWYTRDDATDFRTEDHTLTVPAGPGEGAPIRLSTTLYVPETATRAAPAPAVLLGHGFGGTKRSVAADAEELAGRGYVVLTWTARGFGDSGGQIHLNSPGHEVADAQRLIDWLATRDEVRRDGAGDPKVGVVGASYGGALALSLAGHDRRVDAIVPQVTWHDLADAFLPEATGQGAAAGVFKRAWAGLFFGSGSGLPLGAAGATAPTPDSDEADGGTPRQALPPGVRPDPACGRFAADVCRAYLAVAATGRATPDAVALLRRASPAPVLDRVAAPTLLVQGLADTLFPLSEADANARAIAATGTPTRVAWFSGGHDGQASTVDTDRVKFLTVQWLDHYLRGTGSAPGESFTYSRVTGVDAQRRGLATTAFTTGSYPGLDGDGTGPPRTVTVSGPPQPIANPPGGTPAALSVLPGFGAVSGAAGVAGDLLGQHARFDSAPLASTVEVVGTPSVRLRVASPTREAVLFVKLYDVSPNGQASLPNGLVAPVRLTGLPASPAQAQPVTVTLPGIVHRFDAGHRLRIVVATADQAYAGPPQPTLYTVSLDNPDGAAVSLPGVTATPLQSQAALLKAVLAGLVATIVLGVAAAVVVAWRRRRRRTRRVVAEFADTPLVVRGLRKTYRDGFVAVSNVEFTVERGQVVGLLGPNGAGKTTSLRVLMGLIQPTAGEVFIFGHELTPGAPVLSRIGALVEGPGFLPHLSGVDNLRLFWRSTGRPPADAKLAEVLDIAALGEGIHRKVRTYSHGMKQRLAIAQAMLGLPELLVLDEPTDGLDPPQIAEMRRVLRRYATAGRAVLVSSHLLAEVEQTCTHVVVVHRGQKVASGPVADIVGDSPTVHVEVSAPDEAADVLAKLGVRSVARDGTGTALVVDLDGTPRREMVAALVGAGIGVERVVPRRRLEDAFLALVSGNGLASGDGERAQS